MIILGLDPGLGTTGWGVISAEGNRLRHVTASYTRYLANFLQRHYKLLGTAVKIEYQTEENPYRRKPAGSAGERKPSPSGG